MDRRLLDILCCPVTRQPLTPLTAAQLAALNAAIEGGAVCDAEGNPVSRAFQEGLLTRDGKTLYRVEDGIPVMLAEESIATTQLPGFPA
ncbi:MAG TPA: Trm112 family protein [Xanthomonadaceae bacterium]|nr:Trm112 family protein [Xanthomonadaceae bacterium]